MLAGAVVACRCLPPDSPASPPPARLGDPDLALVAAGDPPRPVRWRLADIDRRNAHSLHLHLHAEDHPLTAALRFDLDPATDLVSQTTTLHHTGDGDPLPIAAPLGCCLSIEEEVRAIVHLAGAWTRETQVRALRMANAPVLMESRTGKTGFGYQPYVALRAPTTTWLCELLWSGNWRLEVEPLGTGALIEGGINAWGFRHALRPGASLDLPGVLFGRVAGRMNATTQRLHDWRNRRRPDPDRPVPVQFNSWFGYFGEPTAADILPVLPVARRLGCEVFVLDAGWYRTDDDDSDAAWFDRTGDWQVSHARFPGGLAPIAEACHAQGLGFGLWFEPESIGVLSSVRRRHPDWLHHLDGRPPGPAERAILHLGVPDAWWHAFERIAAILRATRAVWMKWDFNADLFAGGWAPDLPAELTDEDPLIAHYRGLYRLQDAIRSAFPSLTLEMCASGGGRMDGAILSRAHVNWISDQPGPLRKLAIHFGSQLAHPAIACNDWLVEWPPGPVPGYDDADGAVHHLGDLPFRLRVAMLGSFGISARVAEWSADDQTIAADHVRFYRHHLRPIIQHGRQYLLTMPPAPDGSGDWAAIWYTRRDRSGGVLLAFRLAGADATRVFQLPGLSRDRHYRIRRFEETRWHDLPDPLAPGLSVHVDAPFRSALIRVELAG